jgi:hypothetical protein
LFNAKILEGHEVNAASRVKMVDWIDIVHTALDLRLQTFFLSVNLMDGFFATMA